MLRRNNESGQALVFGVATLGILLIGIAGLGIDMGYLRYQKRLLQAAADSAAIAGASDLAFTGGSGVTPGAQDAAKINGFSDASGNDVGTCTADDPKSAALIGKICVQVNNPPLSGPHSSGANAGQYVEVYVSEVQPTFFMKALKTLSEPITARAVATTVGGGTASGCLYTLGSPADGIEGVNINGAATLTATTCGIVDDGNFNTKGNALTLNSGTFGIAGNWDKSGPGGTVTCAGSSTCPTTTNMPPAADPLAGLVPAPSQPANSSSCPPPVKKKAVACDVTTSGTETLQPGTYDSITLSKNSIVDFAPGIYYINGSGGISMNGGATICNSTNTNCSGMPGSANSGVTFYFTNGATITGTGTPIVQLTAPNSGTYAGILFYQDPNDTNTNGPSLGGDSSSFLQGTLYFPSDQLTFFGNTTYNSLASYTLVIAKALTFSGSPDVILNSNYAGLPNGVSIIKNAVLVE